MSDLHDLLERLKTLSSEFPKLTHTFNFMLGAVYSLQEARRHGHRNRATYMEIDRNQHHCRLHEVIEAVAGGSSPESIWVAGFFYNAAIMRIDACHERFLKAMLEAIDHSPEKAKPGEAETETMAKKIEKTLCIDPPLARIHLASVRTEVNKLKHKLYGQEPRHALARPEPNDIDNAMAAINELVAIMERAEIKSHMSARFAEPPPA